MVPTRTVQRHSSGNGCIFNRVAVRYLLQTMQCTDVEKTWFQNVNAAPLCSELGRMLAFHCHACLTRVQCVWWEFCMARLVYWKSDTAVIQETQTVCSECCRERGFQGWLAEGLTAAPWLWCCLLSRVRARCLDTLCQWMPERQLLPRSAPFQCNCSCHGTQGVLPDLDIVWVSLFAFSFYKYSYILCTPWWCGPLHTVSMPFLILSPF